MDRCLAVAVLLALPLSLGRAGPALAIDCTCRAGGAKFELGETTCLKTPAGPRLARCEMNQNVTSWKPLDTPCPVSEAPSSPRPTQSTAALAQRIGADRIR